jgi:hypothetical protein
LLNRLTQDGRRPSDVNGENDMTKKATTRFLKTVTHMAALAFGAFWLVATSAPTGPARECFTGIGNPTTLRVVLGTPPTVDSGTSTSEPSCQGLDGLIPGSTLVFTLSQGPRPEGLQACWGYQTQAIQGTTDVTLSTAQTDRAVEGLTVADGEFSSSTAQSCRGGWELTLRPNELPESTAISPLDASPTTWHVERSIDVEQAQFCDGAFTQTGTIGCQDYFPVASITQVSP